MKKVFIQAPDLIWIGNKLNSRNRLPNAVQTNSSFCFVFDLCLDETRKYLVDEKIFWWDCDLVDKHLALAKLLWWL